MLFRYFVTVFILSFLISLFWTTFSGTNMFPFNTVVGVSVVLTILFKVVGWTVNMLGAQIFLKNEPNFQRWKLRGSPYWDSLGWPVNTATPIERETGLAEPEYPDFVPPADWR